MQAAHMRLASDFEVGHMRIVKQEKWEEMVGGYRKGEGQIHKRTAGSPLFRVQGVYKKVLVLLVHRRAQMQVDQSGYTRIEVEEVYTQAGVRVVYKMAEVQQVYMWVAQQKDYLRVGWVHPLIQAG